MLSHITVTNYQSIKQASLALGRFTVIVGQTDSGKSALTRALRTLTSNTRGDSFITTGERLTVLQATTDRGSVILKRGSSNEYVLIPDSHPEQQKTFTKLNAQVPTEVSEFLGIEAKDPINFAGQFDTPYLLKSTGSEVARTLGELTNVDVIFRAAAESNKRRRAAAVTIKTRSEDLASLLESIEGYRTLQAQREAITAAQVAITQAAGLQEQVAQLDYLEGTVQDQFHIISECDSLLAQQLPDISTIESAQQELTRFLRVLRDLQQAATERKEATQDEQQCIETLSELEQQYTSLLVSAGQCPTCQQDTTHLHTQH